MICPQTRIAIPVVMLASSLLVVCLLCGHVVDGRVFQYTHNDEDIEWDSKSVGDPGEPLFLTPYIEEGKISEAHELSQVKGVGSIPSYSGFFTVDKDFKSNMFFWFFPAQSGDKSAPVLLWLQGGPGGSSLFGLFVENGPFYVDKAGNLMDRAVSWNKDYAMLYIDNPVGTGFSFTDSDDGYSTNEIQVATNLYNALVQFFTVFQEYQKNEFYISGESYAGKYVPATAHHIHLANLDPNTKLRLNLKGILVGDGWTDPVNMVTSYAPLMMQYGLVCEPEAQYITTQMNNAQVAIQHNDYVMSKNIWDTILGDYYENVTGGSDSYNILRTEEPEDFGYYNLLWEKDDIRRGIHVGNLTYNQGGKVADKLSLDFMDSVAMWLSIVMENYKVLLYNGQLDIVVGPPLTEAYLKVLPWSGHTDYINADKIIWRINPKDVEVAGYARTVGNFTQLILRGAGHILPYDQPARALDMVERFVSGRGFKE